ncbi:hypothetical protein PINS_up023445 [Pythium insidiosum]|nr:hypothetical protein PINS_up023445 [Pythium insidiosum]
MKLLLPLSAVGLLASLTAAAPSDAALFQKHRPVFHFLARQNWMNDPCAPYFDPDTGLYHLFYQSNPFNSSWGNMTWGHAVSQDQVTWTDYPDALHPTDAWDHLGVFSGFARRKAIDGKDTVFYTGVTKLPISWRLEYLFGEHVNYATTSDHGKTWQKGAKPLIAQPPSGLNVTGWRDPYVFDSSALDNAFGNSKGDSHYLITAGGLHGVGPRIFLYQSTNYVDWSYKGFLLAQPKNTTFSQFSGNWGYNFETTNYVELTDADGERHNVMMFAAEGTPRRFPMWATGEIVAPKKPAPGHSNLCEDTSAEQSQPDHDKNEGFFRPKMVGVTEYSDWYANAVVEDPKTGAHVVWGWIVEDNGFEAQPQGWNGILSLPREANIVIVRGIYDRENLLNGPGDWVVAATQPHKCASQEKRELKTIKTLGLKPSRQLELLRGDRVEVLDRTTVSSEKVLQSTGKSFELMAQVTSFPKDGQVGIRVRRSAGLHEFTSVVYDAKTKKVVIDRSQSSTADCTPFTASQKPNRNATEGHFHHFELLDEATCAVRPEPLTFRVFVDVSVVEVFVNDRFVLSSRIYPCENKDSADGISLVSSGGDAVFEKVQVWSNPKHAWAATRQV